MMMSSVTKQMSADVIANLNVTYYGMIAASFGPNITAKATQR
jgi:hypothetical protein